MSSYTFFDVLDTVIRHVCKEHDKPPKQSDFAKIIDVAPAYISMLKKRGAFSNTLIDQLHREYDFSIPFLTRFTDPVFWTETQEEWTLQLKEKVEALAVQNEAFRTRVDQLEAQIRDKELTIEAILHRIESMNLDLDQSRRILLELIQNKKLNDYGDLELKTRIHDLLERIPDRSK